MSEPNWGEFEDRQRAPAARQVEPFDDLCATLFTTPSGKELLQRLRADLFDRDVPPTVPEQFLRFLEGKRQLIRDLEKATERGMEARARAARQQ